MKKPPFRTASVQRDLVMAISRADRSTTAVHSEEERRREDRPSPNATAAAN
jgi:hypothetical protein